MKINVKHERISLYVSMYSQCPLRQFGVIVYLLDSTYSSRRPPSYPFRIHFRDNSHVNLLNRKSDFARTVHKILKNNNFFYKSFLKLKGGFTRERGECLLKCVRSKRITTYCKAVILFLDKNIFFSAFFKQTLFSKQF